MGRKLVREKDLERRRIMAAFDQVLQQVDESCIGWTAYCLGCDQATARCAERDAVLEWKKRHQGESGHEVMMHREWETPDGMGQGSLPDEDETRWATRV
jgi:hypothetical protein